MARRIPESVLHARFLAILPIIESVARYFFRGRPRRHREEYISETVALAWRSFVGLMHRGKDPSKFPNRFAEFAAMSVRNGRRLAGGYNSSDLTTVPAEESGSHLEPLDVRGRSGGNMWAEVLLDAKGYSPADAAATRIDFAVWRMTLSRRNREIADALANGERTTTVARQFGLTPGRVSQLRRELHESWMRFQHELFADDLEPAVA